MLDVSTLLMGRVRVQSLISSRLYKSFVCKTLMQHYPFPSGFPLLLEHSAFTTQQNIARRGEVGTRIEKYRPLVTPPRFVRQLRNNTAQSLVQPSSSALISAFALQTLTPNKHIPLISTPAQAFVRVWVSHPIESTKPTILRNCGRSFCP